ncbi:MAG: HNH endonuclease [Victivallaceae bacterium]|jgi:putative restriction endonuclease
MARKGWTRNELILAINLYCKTPFGRIHYRNPQIIELAKIIGRTPGAVAWKMCNFACIDPSLDRKGASHVARLDVEIWNEFFNNWEDLAFESEKLLAKSENKDVETLVKEDSAIDFPEGKDAARTVKTRVNQSFFRRMILASYDFKCCITEIAIPELLLASHIIPWSKDKANRLNPRNGLCLNALHDKAFDAGLITISDSLTIIVSELVKQRKSSDNEITFLTKFDGKPIILPRKFQPDANFLAYHRENIFKQSNSVF